MMVVVFRSRVRDGIQDQYGAHAAELMDIARQMPGFISAKDYIADDGEQVSIHEWASAGELAAWREHPRHRELQALGRSSYYESYTLYVAESPRMSEFQREGGS